MYFESVTSIPTPLNHLFSHPDKVKLTVNMTMDAVEARFVEITKAYKAYVTCRPLDQRFSHEPTRQSYGREYTSEFRVVWSS